MNKLPSLLNKKGAQTTTAGNLESLLQALAKDLLPMRENADSSNPNKLLLSLMKPGTNPEKPIVQSQSGDPIWFITPVDIDVVNLSQPEVNTATAATPKPAKQDKNSTILTFPAPSS